jgi:hypothetical protein
MPCRTPGRYAAAVVPALALAVGIAAFLALLPLGCDGRGAPVSLGDGEAPGATRPADRTPAPWKAPADTREPVDGRVTHPSAAWDPGSLITPDTPSDEPPRELGEPLDAGGPGLPQILGGAEASVDLGPAIDADDPLDYIREAPDQGTSRNVGDPLDAGEPGRSTWTASGSSGESGGHGAGDPRGGRSDPPPHNLVEIGAFLDAGGPGYR